MSELYTPAGATAAAITRFTAAEAATGTFGSMHRTWQTEIADRTRFLATTGLIAFPATQVTSADANTLDDYEEGTWTPTDNSGAGLTFSTVTATYTKIGRLVVATCRLTYPVTASGANATIIGLPFLSVATLGTRGSSVAYTDETTLRYVLIDAGAVTTASLYDSAGLNITNATMSGNTVNFTFAYSV